MSDGNLMAINHVVVLMLENRSFDHMLRFLYADSGNVTPGGQAFDGLGGSESNPDGTGKPVSVYAGPLTRTTFTDTTNAPETHFGKFADFQAAAAGGTLPPYTFLETS